MEIIIFVLSHHEVGVIDVYMADASTTQTEVEEYFTAERELDLDEGYQIDAFPKTLEVEI